MHHHAPRTTFDRNVALVLLASLALTLACGSEDRETDFTLPSTSRLDGVAFGDNVSDGGRVDFQPTVGDDIFVDGGAGATRYVTYYSFDLGDVPAASVVISATLSLFLRDTLGDPKGMMVLARVDHVDFGTAFPKAPLDATGLDLNFAQISDLTTVGHREIDVTDQVQADLDDGAIRSQFRVRGAISTNNDDVSDVFFLTGAEDTFGTGEPPLLIIEIE